MGYYNQDITSIRKPRKPLIKEGRKMKVKLVSCNSARTRAEVIVINDDGSRQTKHLRRTNGKWMGCVRMKKRKVGKDIVHEPVLESYPLDLN